MGSTISDKMYPRLTTCVRSSLQSMNYSRYPASIVSASFDINTTTARLLAINGTVDNSQYVTEFENLAKSFDSQNNSPYPVYQVSSSPAVFFPSTHPSQSRS
jgi:hypothetical protein